MAGTPKKPRAVKSPKTLIIAEKPSVARDIIKSLPDQFKEKATYFEGKEYFVSYAVGHLLAIAEPGELDEKFKSWSLKNLPILPKAYDLKPIHGTKSQLNTLQRLMLRKDILTIVNACDAGREGELIFQYIVDYVQAQIKEKEEEEGDPFASKTIKRLWLQSMTDQGIREGFEKLRSHEEMRPLSDAAKSRSEADWLVGINSSRGLTSFKSRGGGFFVTPCGRVQTPTLSMIISREKEIDAFVSRAYVTLTGTFDNEGSIYTGKWTQPGFKRSEEDPHARADRIFDPERAKTILKKCPGQKGTVEETTKESYENSPLLYDLTTLQREANTRFGYSAKRTLSILQSLYERHKMLTYPRTSSRYLPEDYLGEVKKIFKNLSKAQLPDQVENFAGEALSKSYIKHSPRIFNNKKVTDHHAIIPTGKTDLDSLNGDEQKLYMVVARRLIGNFFPPTKSLKTLRLTTVAEEVFKTEGKIIVSPGWRAVAGRLEEDKVLEPLRAASPSTAKNATVAPVACSKVDKEELETKPPPRYTEATLLNAMEGAGKALDDEELRESMKEKGIGTPATRATVIEKLVADKYLVKEARELVPTSKAFDLFLLIDKMEIKELASPELTGSWEHKLMQMENGHLQRHDFMKEITENTSRIISSIKNYDEEADRVEASFSPIHGEKFYKHLTYYQNESGTKKIRSFIGGRRMQDDEIAELLREGRIGPFTDFRSRRGVLFPASVILDTKGKVQLDFLNEDADLTLEKLKENDPIGTFFGDDSEVYLTENAFISESYFLSKDEPAAKRNGLRLGRFILGKELDIDNVKRMITGEKSELITGFRSNRTKRLFDAFLQISEKGRIQFSFLPPKGKRKKQTDDGEDEESTENTENTENTKNTENAERTA